jgi:hypothetical protein
MSELFKKLNLKAESAIVVLDAPASFEAELAALAGVKVVRSLGEAGPVGFALTFVQNQADLEARSRALVAQAQGDALLWFAYPKKSSKRYPCDFNRDSGWEALRGAGYESVRMVAIDEDWCALRFRKVAYIKALTRAPR